jgi:hypothetical protein
VRAEKLSISTIGAAVNGNRRPGGASRNGRGLFVGAVLGAIVGLFIGRFVGHALFGAVLGAVVVGFLLYRVNPGRRPRA